jgi:hypothetical protein
VLDQWKRADDQLFSFFGRHHSLFFFVSQREAPTLPFHSPTGSGDLRALADHS